MTPANIAQLIQESYLSRVARPFELIVSECHSYTLVTAITAFVPADLVHSYLPMFSWCYVNLPGPVGWSVVHDLQARLPEPSLVTDENLLHSLGDGMEFCLGKACSMEHLFILFEGISVA